MCCAKQRDLKPTAINETTEVLLKFVALNGLGDIGRLKCNSFSFTKEFIFVDKI